MSPCDDLSMPGAKPDAAWQLDEPSHAGREHLDPAYVAGYDQKSPTDWSDDVATLQALGIGTSSTVVDLGAGTGTFAEAIGPHVRRVAAVDVSEPMVAKMRERGLEAVHAGLLTYEHQGDPPAVALEGADELYARARRLYVIRCGSSASAPLVSRAQAAYSA